MGRLVWSYYLQKILVDGVSFTTPFMVIYLLRYVSLGQVLLLNALQFVIMALLEIPSGAFADVVGKREAVMVGAVCFAISVFIILFGDSVLLFALAFMIMGVANVMISGSHDSMIYDFLEANERSNESTKLYARAEYYSTRFSDLSFLVASGLAVLNLKFLFVLDFLKWGVVFLMANYLPKRGKGFVRELTPYKTNLKESVEFLVKYKYFAFTILVSSVVYAVFLITSSYYQPLMSAAGINLGFFGLAYVLLNQSKGIASRLSYSFEKKMTPNRMITLSLVVKGLVLMGLSIFVNPLIVIVLLLVKVGAEWFRKPFYTSYLARHSPKRNRATIMSFASFTYSVLFVFLSVFFKLLTDNFNMYVALFVSGAFMMLILLFFRTESLVFSAYTSRVKKS